MSWVPYTRRRIGTTRRRKGIKDAGFVSGSGFFGIGFGNGVGAGSGVGTVLHGKSGAGARGALLPVPWWDGASGRTFDCNQGGDAEGRSRRNGAGSGTPGVEPDREADPA